jgi:hypothetical protein
MTLTVICGEGHITKYNLVTVPASWIKETWKCKEIGCKFPEYVESTVNPVFKEVKE